MARRDSAQHALDDVLASSSSLSKAQQSQQQQQIAAAQSKLQAACAAMTSATEARNAAESACKSAAHAVQAAEEAGEQAQGALQAATGRSEQLQTDLQELRKQQIQAERSKAAQSAQVVALQDQLKEAKSAQQHDAHNSAQGSPIDRAVAHLLKQSTEGATSSLQSLIYGRAMSL